ncbi:hypothetical protein KC19_5G186100, partial [Ceratodon purpureus]
RNWNSYTNSYSDSETPPTACLCNLCGKLELASGMTTGAVYKNNNNPLYDLVSPLQSTARDELEFATMGGCPSWVRSMAVEVIVFLVLGGLVTFGLLSLVESVFGAYLAGSCGCLGGKGPQLVADGFNSRVGDWIFCPMDASQAKLTHFDE